MEIYSIDDTKLSKSFGIEMGSICDAKNHSEIGFMFGVVKPGQKTDRHIHDEIEAFILVEGYGAVLSQGNKTTVKTGDVVLFRSFEEHVLYNEGQDELKFVDIYWHNNNTAMTEAQLRNDIVNKNNAPIFVCSTPPTPNGDLHLGHLAGPYYAADVHTRYLKASGHKAYHLTGSDDYQSYVVSLAEQTGSTPSEIASLYSKEIKETLNLLDCEVDSFIETHNDEAYKTYQKKCYGELINSPYVSLKKSKALFDSESNVYLYEPLVSGRCPHCDCSTGGNICEDCGLPNLCHDLVKPSSKLSEKKPIVKEIKRVELNIQATLEQTKQHLLESGAPPRVLQLLERLKASEILSLPITHPSEWGVEAPDIDGQTIWVWPEMAFGFLYNIGNLASKIGAKWDATKPSNDWNIVHFFGYDNSFYHAALYPALYRETFADWEVNIEYHVNEFYLLEQEKFSTSRKHAIWGKELLTPQSVDLVRLHLGLSRPENQRTNFTINELQHTVENIFHGMWIAWFAELNELVKRCFLSEVPDAGHWEPRDINFLADICQFRLTMERAYSGDNFSVRTAASEACRYIERCREYGLNARYLSEHSELHSSFRTNISLQCTAIGLFAQCVYPLMPRFAQCLAFGIGGIDAKQWPDSVKRTTATTKFDLSKVVDRSNDKYFIKHGDSI